MRVYTYMCCVWFNKEVICGVCDIFAVSECTWVYELLPHKTPLTRILYTLLHTPSVTQVQAG